MAPYCLHVIQTSAKPPRRPCDGRGMASQIRSRTTRPPTKKRPRAKVRGRDPKEREGARTAMTAPGSRIPGRSRAALRMRFDAAHERPKPAGIVFHDVKGTTAAGPAFRGRSPADHGKRGRARESFTSACAYLEGLSRRLGGGRGEIQNSWEDLADPREISAPSCGNGSQARRRNSDDGAWARSPLGLDGTNCSPRNRRDPPGNTADQTLRWAGALPRRAERTLHGMVGRGRKISTSFSFRSRRIEACGP